MLKTFLPWFLIFLAALFDSYASYVVKYKFNEMGDIKLNSFHSIISYLRPLLLSPFFLSGIFLFILAPILWFFALNKIDLSVGYPVLVTFHLIFVYLLSFLLLEENFNLYKLFGSILLIISVFLFYKGS
jgi:multidrug transporter EmrE-like cation transporter